MDVLGQSLTTLGNFFGTLLPFLFVLTVVVFFHELGHFLVARWCGVKVQAFSLGFGREIFGFYDRHGTRWRVSWIPLGGYVKFMDDENGASVPNREALNRMSEEERRGAFQNKPLQHKAAIVAAGPIANFILAIVIFAGTYALFGMHVTAPRVDELVADGAAARAGFKAGDLIVSVDGQAIDSFSDMQRIVSGSADRELTFEVNRDGKLIVLKATPARKEMVDRFGNKSRQGVIGIKRNAGQKDWEYRRYGPIDAVWMGTKETYFIISRTLGYLGDVVMGRESADQLGGPIRIAEVSGQVASVGFVALINLTAILSVSIGLLNLFPVPMLDGGHLLFYAIEAVRRRPMSERSQEIGFHIGMALVFMLMIFATWNDRGIVKRWITGIG